MEKAEKGKAERKINDILRENLLRFMGEEGISREEVVRRYNSISGKKIGPSWISQLRTGKPIGKSAIEILARVFHREEWEFYVPHGKGFSAKGVPPAGRMIPVVNLSSDPGLIFRGGLKKMESGGASSSPEMVLSTSRDPAAFYVVCDNPGCRSSDKCQFGDYLLVEPSKKTRAGGYVFMRYRNRLLVREVRIVRRGKVTETVLEPICDNDHEPALVVNGEEDVSVLVFFPITQIVRNLEISPPGELIST